MTVRQAVGLIVSLLAAAPLGRAAGQGQVIQKCEIRPGHQLVNSGALYLKSASDTKFSSKTSGRRISRTPTGSSLRR